jgi:prophage regulatory protein
MTDRLLPWPEVEKRIPFCRQHVGRMEEAGGFPKRVQCGPNRVAWWESEINAWLAGRARGALPQKADLGPKPRLATAPDREDLELLRRLAAEHGLDLVPRKPERRRGGSPP